MTQAERIRLIQHVEQMEKGFRELRIALEEDKTEKELVEICKKLDKFIIQCALRK